MPYGFLADVVVLIHMGFVLFVVAGGLLVWWRRWVVWIHLPAALWGTLVEALGWTCPLTPLENWLRQQAGTDAPSGDFVSRFLLPILYPAELTRPIQISLAIAVVVINFIVYRRWLTPRSR